MFNRKIEKILNEYYENPLNQIVIIDGLRQIEKTFIVKKFANGNYNNVVYINFKVDLNMKKAFEFDLNISQIVSNLSILNSRFKFIPNETVIIFDEIQECSGARASIKPFMEDSRYDIIAIWSLLGIKGYNKNYHGGVSVGFEHIVYMTTMDFEEFL